VPSALGRGEGYLSCYREAKSASRFSFVGSKSQIDTCSPHNLMSGKFFISRRRLLSFHRLNIDFARQFGQRNIGGLLFIQRPLQDAFDFFVP